jgi:DNA-binding NarL/FixJ family response regulator
MLATEPDIEIVAGPGPEAVAIAAGAGLDVILMDLRMPGGDGGIPRVLVLTTYDTDADILRAVEAGAAGYLLKDATSRELAEAVRAAARGETVLAPSAAGRTVTHLRRPQEPAPPQLSARETEVIARAARGMTNAEVGRAPYISEATSRRTCCAPAPARRLRRTAAAAAAAERGLLKPRQRNSGEDFPVSADFPRSRGDFLPWRENHPCSYRSRTGQSGRTGSSGRGVR